MKQLIVPNEKLSHTIQMTYDSPEYIVIDKGKIYTGLSLVIGIG